MDGNPATPTGSSSTPIMVATSLSVPLETPTASATPFLVGPSDTPTPTFEPTPENVVIFAVIGDYGSGNRSEGLVAELVNDWQPDFIITTGDNNYPDGSEDTIDATIGQFYHDYIYPYLGDFGEGADQNRFFPSLGNHDWITDDASPYLDYFTLPGNERYYEFTWGLVHFFAVDSDSNEPDGVGRSSRQAEWLQAGLADSTLPWKIVYMHHPPYSSGLHGSVTWMRWPFNDWGATAVLAGHDHDYERLLVDGMLYFVNGLGGGGIYPFNDRLDGSQVRYNDDYGAMRVEATAKRIIFQFISRDGEVIDSYDIEK